MKNKIKIMVVAAMFAAIICVVTMAVAIPIPVGGIGYVNPGDAIVLLAAWFLPPVYSFFAAGIGSALADILLSWAVYAPATFVIKGAMALAAYFVFRALGGKKLFARVISAITSELIMILGYFLFESILYGFASAVPNAAFNAVQGVVGILFGVLLAGVFGKYKIFNK